MIEAGRKIKEADAIVIGAGAGLSASAGLTYDGPRFQSHFGAYIQKYGMKDMYSAGFYPFETQEEKWAYWSRHIVYNRFTDGGTKVYLDLLTLMEDRNYFVLTTNVDHQFQLSGFAPERIFATQGDYGLFQCAKACHSRLYDNEMQVKNMVAQEKDCRIPKELVPICPVCGGPMEVNLRCDQYFVEDDNWHLAAKRYHDFLNKNSHKKILYLELGVGLNTPGIIKYPFWQMTYQQKKAFYISVNKGQAWAPDYIRERTICIDSDIGEAISKWIGR